MVISAGPSYTSERLDHPNERLMMMSAARWTVLVMMSAGPPSTSELLHHPNERLMMMSAASLTARAAIFDDDVGVAFLHE